MRQAAQRWAWCVRLTARLTGQRAATICNVGVWWWWWWCVCGWGGGGWGGALAGELREACFRVHAAGSADVIPQTEEEIKKLRVGRQTQLKLPKKRVLGCDFI